MIGSKIIEIGIGTTQTDINNIIKEEIEQDDEIKYIIKVFYGINMDSKMIGPLNVGCSVIPIINGKQSKKNMKVNNVYWTEKELETYKLKKGDFKLIVKGLLNETIESNPFKKYTRKDLDI